MNIIKSIIDVNITCYFEGNFDFDTIIKVYPLSEICNNSSNYIMHLDDEIFQYADDISEIIESVQSQLNMYIQELKDARYIKLLNTNITKQWAYISHNEERIFEASIFTDIPEVREWFDSLLKEKEGVKNMTNFNTTVRTYRKKPVIIEQYQTDKELYIETLEGTMKANIGDYIITGINGEKYPCKPDIFKMTYELVE